MEWLNNLFELIKSVFGLDIIRYSIRVVLILALAILLNRFIRAVINKYLTESTAEMKTQITSFQFLKNMSSLLIFLLATTVIFYSIPELRNFGLGLVAGAGVFAAVLGLAAQEAFSNIVSGIFIVIFKPYRVGDIISVGEIYSGVVEDINLRHSVIRNFENRRIIIPNATISKETLVNSNITEEKTCMHVVMSISYDANIDLAMRIMEEEALKHPLCIDARTDEQKTNNEPQVLVKLISFGDSSVNLRAWCWAQTPGDGFTLRCDLFKSIKERFDEAGIEIPFPYRTLVMKTPLKVEKDQQESES